MKYGKLLRLADRIWILMWFGLIGLDNRICHCYSGLPDYLLRTLNDF